VSRIVAAIIIAMSLALSAAPGASAAKIERVITPGGIEAWLVQDHTLPMLSLQFGFQGGAAQDPADKPGVAHFAAALLDEGAGDLDARAFQERLERNAITLSFNAVRDTLKGSLKTLNENRDEAFELLRLALTAPRFDADAVERVRAGVLAGLRRRSTSASDIASERWYARAFPAHPYGRPVEGTLDSVPRISGADLKAYIRNVAAKSNLKIAAVGSIDAATLAALIDRAFGALPDKATLVAVAEAAPQGLGSRQVIDLDVPQTVIAFGGLGLKRSDPDFIPAYVLNHILGGGSFSSRLYREVREKRGLAYSVYSYLAPYQSAGLFLGGVSTRNDRAAESLAIIVAEIKRIATEGPTEDELQKARQFLIGSYALRFDTSGKIASQLLDIQLENLGIDYIDRRNGLIAAVRAEDIKRAAARFLADDRLLVTLVGRPHGVASGGP
jgi:zinc protease